MTEMQDVIVPITGRRRSGKDTMARVAIKSYGCAGSVALSDWFKRVLSNEFKIPLADFYSAKKDEQFSQPMIIQMRNLRNLKTALQASLGSVHDMRITRISVSKWDSLEINSIRDLMVWFGHEFVSLNLGHEFHNRATDGVLKSEAIPRKEKFNVIFVTDARQYPQSNYYNKHYKFVYPVRIVRPDGTSDTSAPEAMTDQFPEGYFFAEILNDGTLAEFEEKVKKVLNDIRENIKLRVYGPEKLVVPPVVVPRRRGRPPKIQKDLGYNTPVTHEASRNSSNASTATETGK